MRFPRAIVEGLLILRYPSERPYPRGELRGLLMRTMRSLLIASMLGLTLLLAPVVLADRGEDGRAKADTARAGHADGEPVQGDARGLNATERSAARENASADRAAAWSEFQANSSSLRASWKTSAVTARDACHAAAVSENATSEEREASAHCIRDAYRVWRVEHRVELRELHQALHQLFASWGKRLHHG